MRAKIALVLLAFVPLCSLARAQGESASIPPPNVASSQIYITHVTVIDTETGKEANDRTVVISGERISEVRGSKDVRPSKDAKVVVDAQGKYLIPGLWDMHTHAVRQETVASMFPMFVANGVLGIRDTSNARESGRSAAKCRNLPCVIFCQMNKNNRSFLRGDQ